MSEYQYYEFQAIDRPLDKNAQQTLRSLSSRARITATSFTNTYQWGDFKGDPEALMERWFDLHVYLANWGSRRLMIRVPERLVDRGLVDVCLVEPDLTNVRVAGEHLILDIECRELDTEWEEGPGWLETLAPLRADLLAGDSRLLYLVWLMAVECDAVSADTLEPLPGIGPMSGSLEAFATFFGLDPDLVQAASEREGASSLGTIAPAAARQTISSLCDREKIDYLMRVVDGDPHAAAELRASVRSRLDAGNGTINASPRTAGELRVRAEAIRQEREQEAERIAAEAREQCAREAEKKRRERLLAVARRGEAVWRDVDDEIERSNASAYDRAAELLLDLRAVAEERDSLLDFARRIAGIRQRHTRKARFLQRIEDLR